MACKRSRVRLPSAPLNRSKYKRRTHLLQQRRGASFFVDRCLGAVWLHWQLVGSYSEDLQLLLLRRMQGFPRRQGNNNWQLIFGFCFAIKIYSKCHWAIALLEPKLRVTELVKSSVVAADDPPRRDLQRPLRLLYLNSKPILHSCAGWQMASEFSFHSALQTYRHQGRSAASRFPAMGNLIVAASRQALLFSPPDPEVLPMRVRIRLILDCPSQRRVSSSSSLFSQSV